MSQSAAARRVPVDQVAAARNHYQNALQAYLSARTPHERQVRGAAMQTALRMTLETRHAAA